ncbi:MAG: hypothetical protein IJV96_01300 [Clostridia bacterium]|nr:hypothetical protein [Clostridia bacterium]
MKTCRVMILGRENASVSEYTVKERFPILLFFLLERYDRIEFLVGGDGAFETHSVKFIERAQKAIGTERIAMTLLTDEKSGDASGDVRFKQTIDECDAVACFIDRPEGDAYDALLHAQHHGKEAFNFAFHMVNMW